MSNIEDFFLNEGAGIPFRSVAGTPFSRASAAPIFVDVSENVTKAKVTRGGFDIGEIVIRPDLLDDVLVTRPIVRTNVVSQSIAAGTAVARGTAIDIVVTRTDDLPIRVIPGIHEAFLDQTVLQVFTQFEDNSTVRDIIRRRTDFTQLTTAEQTQFAAALETTGVTVGTEQTNNGAAAFAAIQAAFTFQG